MHHESRLADFTRRDLTFLGERRPVYVLGDGPAVLVIHEAPGLHPKVADFARRVARAGYRVYCPSLVGTPGKPFSVGYSLQTLARACVAREFTVWATRETSPITAWLRALAAQADEECGGRGVGAIGMCLTGGFALAMMVDERMVAPVLSQPSLPFPFTPSQRRDLGIDDATLARVKERAAAGACVLGLRFTHDPLMPPERFDRLRAELGDAFVAVEIDSGPENAHGIPRIAHSVLAHDFVDRPGHPTVDALEKVLDFLRERLPPGVPPAA